MPRKSKIPVAAVQTAVAPPPPPPPAKEVEQQIVEPTAAATAAATETKKVVVEASTQSAQSEAGSTYEERLVRLEKIIEYLTENKPKHWKDALYKTKNL